MHDSATAGEYSADCSSATPPRIERIEPRFTRPSLCPPSPLAGHHSPTLYDSDYSDDTVARPLAVGRVFVSVGEWGGAITTDTVSRGSLSLTCHKMTDRVVTTKGKTHARFWGRQLPKKISYPLLIIPPSSPPTTHKHPHTSYKHALHSTHRSRQSPPETSSPAPRAPYPPHT